MDNYCQMDRPGPRAFFPKHRRQPREEIDFWLDEMNLYRKRVARDGACVFRIVAEQVFHIEMYHGIVRRACVRYLERNSELFAPFVKEDFNKYLASMRAPETPGGVLELKALSALYKCKFLIFDRHHHPPRIIAADASFSKCVRLATGGGTHYDSVHHKSELTAAGISQALVYEMLYEDVFGMEGTVATSVHLMLNQPPSNRGYQERTTEHPRLELDGEAEDLFEKFGPPFPYKVAKSLQPFIYRNVGFDCWIEDRKYQLRMAQGYVYGPQYTVGAKCLVPVKNSDTPGDPDRMEPAFIQKLTPDKGAIEVIFLNTGKTAQIPHEDIKFPETPDSRASSTPSGGVDENSAPLANSKENPSKSRSTIRQPSNVKTRQKHNGRPFPPRQPPRSERPPLCNPSGGFHQQEYFGNQANPQFSTQQQQWQGPWATGQMAGYPVPGLENVHQGYYVQQSQVESVCQPMMTNMGYDPNMCGTGNFVQYQMGAVQYPPQIPNMVMPPPSAPISVPVHFVDASGQFCGSGFVIQGYTGNQQCWPVQNMETPLMTYVVPNNIPNVQPVVMAPVLDGHQQPPQNSGTWYPVINRNSQSDGQSGGASQRVPAQENAEPTGNGNQRT